MNTEQMNRVDTDMLPGIRIISSQKIYGLYGLKHHIVDKRRCYNAGRTSDDDDDDEELKIELLSQAMEAGG